jgi:hypothetical protein
MSEEFSRQKRRMERGGRDCIVAAWGCMFAGFVLVMSSFVAEPTSLDQRGPSSLPMTRRVPHIPDLPTKNGEFIPLYTY